MMRRRSGCARLLAKSWLVGPPRAWSVRGVQLASLCPPAWHRMTFSLSVQNRAFGRWADNAFERIDERAKSGGTEQNVRKGESGTAQQPTASPPALDVAAPTPVGGETKVGEEPDHGGPAGRLARDDGRLLDGSGGAGRDPTPNRNEPLCTVGLVFMEDKTMGFPRVFVMDVIPDRTATQCTLNGGNLLVLIDNEDVYGRDLDYIATILPGR